MSVKAKLEAVIYATEEPVTLDLLASLVRDAVLAELAREEESRLALNQAISHGEPESSNEPVVAESPAEASELAVAQTNVSADSEPQDDKKEELRQVKAYLKKLLDELTEEYAASTHGVEVRQVAGGYRMATKPEQHDLVVAFAKSLKPPVRLSLQALETLAVIAYKQPVTAPEISEIRGVDSSGVLATLLDRKLITTAGRKQVIGRPILYKTTREFLLRFGLNNVSELPSIEEFEKLGDPQTELFAANLSSENVASAVPSAEDPSTESPDASAVAVDQSLKK
ncbi:MAG TPA: SMC-Scp complex subunit ScpB [Candidatus Binatia bacterium]|jgi:segregation and condensation protein B|nr:SMC-Scp complex subunit ScpB [Candidatus Binatia bacterium]